MSDKQIKFINKPEELAALGSLMSGKGSDRQYRLGQKARDFGVRIAILPLLTSDKLFDVPGPQLFPLLNSGTHLAQSGEFTTVQLYSTQFASCPSLCFLCKLSYHLAFSLEMSMDSQWSATSLS